jgi:hypothetical protein
VVVHLKPQFVTDDNWAGGKRAHHELGHDNLIANPAGIYYDGLCRPVEAMDFTLDVADQIFGPTIPTPGLRNPVSGLLSVK